MDSGRQRIVVVFVFFPARIEEREIISVLPVSKSESEPFHNL